MKLYSVVLMVFMVFFMGCQNKDDVTEFNKPAFYWYKQIATTIMDKRLNKADAYYISLKSEHIRSPLMPTALMMLVTAHMDEDEYLLANFYLDEYNKLFANYQTQEHSDFLKLKASFLGIQDVYKDQKLVLDSIKKSKTYLYRYPTSVYSPLVNTMLIKLHMSQYLLNENIASLYERIDKPKAGDIYRAKNRGSLVEMTDILPPKQTIIGQIFD